MKVALLFAVVIALAFAAGPPRPNISELFEATGRLMIDFDNFNFTGKGTWRVDEPGNKGVEAFEFDEDHLDYYFLQRYDEHHEYDVNRKELKCTVRDVSGNMPLVWNWINNAVYAGKVTFKDKIYDVWNYTFNDLFREIAVFDTDPNRPAVFARRNLTSNDAVAVHFDTWATSKPHESWFIIPGLCNKTRDSAIRHHSPLQKFSLLSKH